MRVIIIIRSGLMVHGRILQPGEVLQPGDYYQSTSGEWDPCPCAGIVLQEGAGGVFVRPEAMPQ